MFILHFSVALTQNTTGITTATTMAAASGNGLLAPHMRPCALHQRFKWMVDNPPSLWMYFGGGLRVCMALKALLCPGVINCHNIGVFWGPYTPSTTPNFISTCLGGCHPSIWCIGTERKALCGALGGLFRWQRPWLAMVVLVNAGRWRLTSDQPIVGIV